MCMMLHRVRMYDAAQNVYDVAQSQNAMLCCWDDVFGYTGAVVVAAEAALGHWFIWGFR